MQELLNSLVKFSAAMTVFGMQQVQSAVGSVDNNESMGKFREVIDAMSAAVSSKIDESRRPTVDTIANLPQDIIGRTMELPRDVMQNTTGMVKNTSDWLNGMMKSATAPVSAEPKPLEEILIIS